MSERDDLGTRYRLHIRTLSPVHVGSGEPDLETRTLGFVTVGERLAVLDPDKLAHCLSEAQFDLLMHGTPMREILRKLDTDQLSEAAAYTLPAPSGRTRPIRPHIKIPGSPPSPYLPGSSIKGALRTALAWAMLVDEECPITVNYQRDKRGNLKPEAADDIIDQNLFQPGLRDPAQAANYDIMRALHVGDSRGLSLENGLSLAQVAVYSLRGGREMASRFRLFLEVIPHDVELVATARLDRYLLDSEDAQELQFGRRSDYLSNMLSHVNAFANEIIERELDFYQHYGLSSIVQAYQVLKRNLGLVEKAEHSCLVQVAWGTGWRGKTVGLSIDPARLDEIRRHFALGLVTHQVCGRKVLPERRGGGWYCTKCRQGRLGLDDLSFYSIFPKTRRLAEAGRKPIAPLGWLLLTFEPAGATVSPPAVSAIMQGTSDREEIDVRKRELTDLRIGEIIEGTVVNIAEFGAFVDIGVDKDGLIHISELDDGYIRRVENVVKRGDVVTVEVIKVDLERRRIGLRLVAKRS